MNPPRIAACLIVKDSAKTIERCLESIRPFVDGVFVYDTGSTDGTPAVLAKLNELKGMRVGADGQVISHELHLGRDHEASVAADAEKGIQFVPLAPIVVEQGEWRNDFAWAREQSFAMPDATYDFVLWLDDDDELVGGQWLRMLAGQAHPSVDGFIFQYDYARDETGATVCVLWRERLLRRSAGYVWREPIHEVLIPPEGHQPQLVQVSPEQVRYVHRRDLVPDRYEPDRNLKILHAKADSLAAEGKPIDPRTLAYLGTEYMAKGDWARAADYLDQYIQHPDAAWSDERAQVHHKLATCLRALGNHKAGIHIELESVKERAKWAENYVGLAQAYGAIGDWDSAAWYAELALKAKMPISPLILNPLEFTVIPLLVLAEARANLGDGTGSRAAIAQALQVAPLNGMVRAHGERLDGMLAENELVAKVLELREVLVRHDENMKAHELMGAVPYIIAERPEIVKARADQKLMVDHALHPEEYRRWYADEPKESTVSDDIVAKVGEYIPRAARVLELCQEFEEREGRKPRVLDLGANDMWLACYLWVNAQVVCDGIELNSQSIEKGRARIQKFEAPGRYVQGDLHDAKSLLGNGHGPAVYDLVLLFEVLEHVPDMNRTLDVLESLCGPDGLVCISTPNGAFERGQIDRWASVELKGHLRAIPIHELSQMIMARGSLETLELQHDDHVAFVAYKPTPRKGKVTFYAGASWEPWSPRSVNDGGLGGSETALIHLSIQMAQDGYQVTVYSGAEPGIAGGVLFRPHTAWDPTDDCDLLIVSRIPHVVDNPVRAKATALWCHDNQYDGLLTEERAQKFTHIVCLSDWQRSRFEARYPYAAEKLRVIRNGISLTALGEPRFPDQARPFAERAPRCVYSSSADRGLDVMLTVWPEIRARVPDAELHVFYGFDVFDRVAQANPQLHAFKQAILARVDELGGEDGGVHLRGRVGQKQLADEMQQARVLSYPTAFLETSCIVAMEARAAGLPIVTSDLGALHETVGEHGLLITWGNDETEQTNQTPDYQEAFVAKVTAMLLDEKQWGRWHRKAIQGVDGITWESRLPEWTALVPAADPIREAVPA
jgi:glycosyltransferase involved in cell wall biosynthesis/2-polyprenyl-3-methyl-5-hydroxy-6-metoxy-1,4-benzoquinol methylase